MTLEEATRQGPYPFDEAEGTTADRAAERMPFDEPLETPDPQGPRSKRAVRSDAPQGETDGRTVIASVIASPHLMADLDFVEPADFDTPQQQRTWVAIVKASRSSTTLDAGSLTGIDPSLDRNHLEEMAAEHRQNGAACVATATRMARRRRSAAAVQIMQQAINDVRRAADGQRPDGGSWEGVFTDAALAGLALAKPNRVKSAATLESRIRAGATTRASRIRTGITRLDEFLSGGLRPGQILAVGGSAKVGKTVLAATISGNMERDAVSHCVITTTGTEDYYERLKVSRRIGVNATHLENMGDEARLRLEDLPQFDRSCDYLHYPGISVEDLRAAMLQRRYATGTRLVIIDRLQTIGGRQRGEQAEAHMNRACQVLQATAAESGLAVIVTVQLDDTARIEGYGNAIRQCADALLVLNRDRGMTDAYLETQASNLANEADVGSVSAPSLRLDMTAGPHFISLDPP